MERDDRAELGTADADRDRDRDRTMIGTGIATEIATSDDYRDRPPYELAFVFITARFPDFLPRRSFSDSQRKGPS